MLLKTHLLPTPPFFPGPSFTTSSPFTQCTEGQEMRVMVSPSPVHVFCRLFLLKGSTSHSPPVWQHGIPSTGYSPPWASPVSVGVFCQQVLSCGKWFSSEESHWAQSHSLFQDMSPVPAWASPHAANGPFHHSWSLSSARVQPAIFPQRRKLWSDLQPKLCKTQT